MTFLEICQRLRQECGVQGTGPSAVTGQTGELKRIVDWAASAYNEIQGKHPNWRWLRSTWQLSTVAETDAYAYSHAGMTDARLSAAISRFKRWWPFDEEGYANVQLYKQSDGVGTERRISWMDWPTFRHQFKMGTQTSGFPGFFTIDPQNRLVFGPKPDAVYVASGEYQMSAQSLAADANTPEMPDDFHMLVVYRGMEKYGAFKAATEVFTRGASEGGRLMTQLELEQLPAIALAEPLA